VFSVDRFQCGVTEVCALPSALWYFSCLPTVNSSRHTWAANRLEQLVACPRGIGGCPQIRETKNTVCKYLKMCFVCTHYVRTYDWLTNRNVAPSQMNILGRSLWRAAFVSRVAGSIRTPGWTSPRYVYRPTASVVVSALSLSPSPVCSVIGGDERVSNRTIRHGPQESICCVKLQIIPVLDVDDRRPSPPHRFISLCASFLSGPTKWCIFFARVQWHLVRYASLTMGDVSGKISQSVRGNPATQRFPMYH